MNILYIDDDASNRAVIRAMLATAGMAMAEAGDAQTGLRMIEENKYALILMDLRMPHVSGLTAIRQLRSMAGSLGATPIVVVTADLTDGVRDLCRSAGADDFLAKPVAMPALFDAMGAALARSTSAQIH